MSRPELGVGAVGVMLHLFLFSSLACFCAVLPCRSTVCEQLPGLRPARLLSVPFFPHVLLLLLLLYDGVSL